jgi:plasmid stabilization system protein ParE
MGHVTYLPDAIEDLHRIWSYVAEKSQSMEVIQIIHGSRDIPLHFRR